ncbi:MAG: lipocalin family protein [Tenacibaculum sp.]
MKRILNKNLTWYNATIIPFKNNFKLIKKTFILALSLCLGLFFVSCSDDENEEGQSESIAGVWQLYKEGNLEGETEVSDCEKKTTLKFNSDGTFESITYVEVEINDEIICDGGDGGSGVTWKDIGNNTISLSTDEITDEIQYSFVNGNLKLPDFREVEQVKDAYLIFKRQ